MATVYGITGLSWEPQPDFGARQSEEGSWRGSQTFAFSKADLDNYAWRQNFVLGAKPSTLDPSLPVFWDFMGLISVDIVGTEGTVSEIRVRYSGSSATYQGEDAAAEVVTYSLSASMGQRSVIYHPDVVALGADDRRKLGLLLDGGIFWDENDSKYRIAPTTHEPFSEEVTFTAGDATTWARKIVEGHHTIDAPTILWTEHKERKDQITSAELGSVGKVDSPPGNPPATGTRNWRLNSATSDFDGQTYRMSRQWELSLLGGWDSDIYDY